MKTRNIIIIIIVALVAIGGLCWWLWAAQNGPSKYDAFAQCLSQKGLKFYGAFWCPHCQDQKSMFGSAKQYLPYVECSTPDANGQLRVCTDAGIQEYPTWIFPDGTKSEGELSLQDLAIKSGC